MSKKRKKRNKQYYVNVSVGKDAALLVSRVKKVADDYGFRRSRVIEAAMMGFLELELEEQMLLMAKIVRERKNNIERNK